MLRAMLLALLLVCHSAAAWKASDETIRVVGDRRQGLSGSTARNAAAEMIKSKLATQTTRRRLECVDYDDDSCLNCGPLDLEKAFNGTKCESTSCGVSICNTDAAPARRISVAAVAAAVAALVFVLIA